MAISGLRRRRASKHLAMRYFTLSELTHSDTAVRKHIPNVPTLAEVTALNALVDNVLDPLRVRFGKPILVNSGYRSKELNRVVGGASTSQHVKGQAADITAADPRDNATLFRLLYDLLPYDQLIWEKGDDTHPAWIHVSYAPRLRHQCLRYRNGSYRSFKP